MKNFKMRKKPLSLKKLRMNDDKSDKINVTKFSVKPLKPKAGLPITIKMTIKNVSSSVLKFIPWQIGKDKKILDSGVHYDLKAGDSFTVCITSTAVKGEHFYYSDADPENTLQEPRAKQLNNFPQGVDIVVR